jgi:hypothetical protein
MKLLTVKMSKRAFTFLFLFSVIPLAAEAECEKITLSHGEYQVYCDDVWVDAGNSTLDLDGATKLYDRESARDYSENHPNDRDIAAQKAAAEQRDRDEAMALVHPPISN